MVDILTALVPLFAVIALGWGLRRHGAFGDAFWETAERLIFHVLFPALLIVKIGGAEVPGAELAPLSAVLFVTTAGVTAVVVALRPRLGLDGPAFVSILQGATRFNTYVGLAAAFALFGEAGLTLAAVCILAAIPLVNAVSVFAHLKWADPAGGDAGTPWRPALIATARNPIIVGCLIGAWLNLTGWGLPPLIGEVLDILGRAALPLGLMAVGAGLNLRALRLAGGPAAGAVAVKLVVMPFLASIVCGVFGVTGVAASVAVLFAALPVSATSYVMARQLGGDGELMAAIVALSTLAAIATLPVIVSVYGS